MKNHDNVTVVPKCVNGEQEAFGFTNRGELIPCCWCDTQRVREDPDYQKLLAVSNIKDHDSIEEIFLQDEWVEFYSNLRDNQGFEVCYTICKKRDGHAHKKENYVDTDTGEIKHTKAT